MVVTTNDNSSVGRNVGQNDNFLIARVALSIALIAVVIAFAANRHFYLEALVSAFFSVTLASTAILYFHLRPRWPGLLAIACFTAFLYLLDYRILKFPPSIVAGFSFFGLSSLMLLGIRAAWAEEHDRKQVFWAFGAALLFVGSDYMASTMLDYTEAMEPKTLDLYLYSFDSSLRVPFSVLAGQSFSHFHWLKVAAILFYIGLPIPLVLVSAGHLVRKNGRLLSAVLAFLITGPLGILFYNVFPAMGPVHILGGSFALHPLTIEQVKHLVLEPIVVRGPRNAIPSLHMAWAILALWYSGGLSWLTRVIVWMFLIFTVVATLGTGEHYLVDLVAAVPFALFIRGICTPRLLEINSRRTTAVVTGLTGTLGLLAVLRFGIQFVWISPIIPWALVIVMTVGPILLRNWLERGEELQQGFAAAQDSVLPATSDAVQPSSA